MPKERRLGWARASRCASEDPLISMINEHSHVHRCWRKRGVHGGGGGGAITPACLLRNPALKGMSRHVLPTCSIFFHYICADTQYALRILIHLGWQKKARSQEYGWDALIERNAAFRKQSQLLDLCNDPLTALIGCISKQASGLSDLCPSSSARL